VGSPRVVGMIPARYASTRLPGKPLVDICGKTMIQRVYERVRQAKTLSDLIVATDDRRILDAVLAFGGKAEMTSADHASGTDRLAELARRTECDLVVNIQGDEPLFEPAGIDAAVAPLLADESLQMSTLAVRIHDVTEWEDRAVTKVVVDQQGYALYFSKAKIPFFRLGEADAPEKCVQHPVSGTYPLKHIGMYVYRRDFLIALSEMPRTPLEISESLEQLRALENGYRIKVVEVDYSPISVDTEEDLERVRVILAKERR
jgi:3-deoxy-manno-octulosonate cytidylyltransferase (CMP-KDO synthetase)